MKLILTRPIMKPGSLITKGLACWVEEVIQSWAWYKGIGLGKIEISWNNAWKFWDLKVYMSKAGGMNFDVLPEFFMSMDLEKMEEMKIPWSNDPEVLEIRRYFLYPKEENGLS